MQGDSLSSPLFGRKARGAVPGGSPVGGPQPWPGAPLVPGAAEQTKEPPARGSRHRPGTLAAAGAGERSAEPFFGPTNRSGYWLPSPAGMGPGRPSPSFRR